MESSAAGDLTGIDLVRLGLDALRDESPADRPAVVLGEQLVALESLAARLRFEQARRAAAFDSAGGAVADGLPTAAAWIRANTLASPGDASEMVEVGRALRDRLPAAESELSHGAISWGAASAIAHALRGVRDPDVLSSADSTLSALAPTLTPPQVAHAARRVLEHLDPELAQRDTAQRWADRTLTLAPMLDGAVAMHGQLDEESAAVLLSALTPMMTPRGPEDTRSAGQRRLDSLVELVGKEAEVGAAGTTTGTGLPPTLLVRVDIERLAQLDRCPEAPAASSASAASPASHASSAPSPLAEMDWGGPILDETLRRIGCTAGLVRLVTSGKSRVLDLGRAKRLASPAQQLALAARDNGCLFPGCDRPPEWTDAHHTTPWSKGGRTDLDGLLSACRFHHRLFHEGGWTLRRTPHGYDVIDDLGRVHDTIPMPRLG